MENRYLCDTARHVATTHSSSSKPWPCCSSARPWRPTVAPAGRWDCGPAPVTAPSPVAGRVLILPGVGNTRFHLAGFVAATEAQLPRFDVEVRTWGKPFMTIHNLRAHERNVATAASIAAEIAAWRRANPDAPFYLVGYSGGGGMATLVTAALPDDVAIDRLVLVAPAISPDYPLATDVLAARARVRRQLRERARSASRLGHAHVRHDRSQEHRRAPARSASPPRTSACCSTTGRRPTRRSVTPAITWRISTGVGRPRSCCRRSTRPSTLLP